MASLPKTTIQHFTHPDHPLQIHEDKQYYKCDGCKLIGSGKRYRCHSCCFDLHEHCATCPTTFSSFVHPQHPLSLVVPKPQATRQNQRICDVCDDQVEGLSYRCKLCDFDVHPLCTQFPQHVRRHVLHPAHLLTLQPSSASYCLVCKSVCTSWRYRCGTCCVDIHLDCILEPSSNSESAGEPKDSLIEAQLQQSVDLGEKESEEKSQRFIEKFHDGKWLKVEPESSKQPKAIPSPVKGEESVYTKNEQYPTFDRQRQVISKCGLGLTKSPEAEEWYDAEMINLMDNKLSNLPDEPICPKLYTLSLRENYNLRKIPFTFFTNMPLLKFLDLSQTSIMSLPKSVFELAHLKRLYLMKCKFLMVLPPEVGKLKRLEVLDMEGTEIFNLPVEIQELSLLRRLRVSFYGCIHRQDCQSRQSNSMIPFGVISALSKLQEVNIGVNPDDEQWDACVETIMNEVFDLSGLKTLMFYFPRVELLRYLKWNHTVMISPSLSDFRFIVGRHSKRIISRLPSGVEFELERQGWYNRCLKYINGEGVVPDEIKKVLKHATAFHLDRHMTVKKLTEFGIDNMEHLKGCLLGECNEIQVIIDGNDIHNGQIVCESTGDRRIGLESLEFLYIYYMKNLKTIWEGPVDESSLSYLKALTLSTCPQLITIFTVELLENLNNLKELTVRDCPAIKSLVSCEEGAKQSTSYLPELRTISLHYVPNLVSISSEVYIAPKLESLSFYNCPKLKCLSIKEVSSKHLTNISGETDWWKAVELTQVQHDKFDDIFVSINADTLDNGPTGNDLETYERRPKTKLFLLKGYACGIDLGDLKRLDLVSKGAHVTSYKCNTKYRDVYVKSINLEVPVRENEFKRRMKDIGKVGQHPNIMLPFGYLFSVTARYLFYKYAPASSLYAFLREPKSLGTRPHWDHSLKIILGVARGISHIHSRGGIIHGNIKSSNVIVTADYDGCISDFGLAPMMNIPAPTPELGAPELKETGEATQKSDVYNFGVMLSEIMDQHNNVLGHWIVGLTQVQIRLIIFRCKNRYPDRRPKMDEVVRLIQEVQSGPSDQTKTMKKIVIKVSMDGPKSRSKAMDIAARLLGVDSISFKGEDKNQLVVTGEGLDAVQLTSLLRKNLGSAELISVSPVEEEEKEGGSEKQPMVWLPSKELEEKTTRLFIEKCQEIDMARNVFGTPITNSTLEGMPEYLGKVITRKDRAHVALKMKNAGQKDYNAQRYVDNLKASYGNGVSTKCMIYNATGDDLTFVLSHEWYGHIGESPYPHTIQNGQWGAFLHVHTSGATVGSSAAVVYSGLNNDGHGRDWLLSWITPWVPWHNNKAFAEVREAGHYESNDYWNYEYSDYWNYDYNDCWNYEYNDYWNYIYNLMEDSKQTHTDSWGGSVSNATTGTGTDVYFGGIMTLENA